MRVSIGKDFQKLWDRHFPEENLGDFYSKIFEIYNASPNEQLSVDVVQAHAALYKHEYALTGPDQRLADVAIKDAVISKALIHLIHQRNGQHFVEPEIRPFNSDAQPWLSTLDLQGTISILERTGVNYCELHLHSKIAPDGRECFEMHEVPENERLTDAKLDVVRQEFGNRSADTISRSFIDNSGLAPYEGQSIDWGIEELITDPDRPSRYPRTPEQAATAKARLEARFRPLDADME